MNTPPKFKPNSILLLSEAACKLVSPFGCTTYKVACHTSSNVEDGSLVTAVRSGIIVILAPCNLMRMECGMCVCVCVCVCGVCVCVL